MWESPSNPSQQSSEHHVTRYVMLIILKVFNILEWNLVPQFYTHSGKWPDLVLESFEYEPEKNRNIVFVPRVYIEFKQQNNKKDPIAQLLESIEHPGSPLLSSKGYLIGITGTNWTIMEFQRVIAENAENPITLLYNFFENPEDMPTIGRPKPSKAYTKKENINISNKQGFDDMAEALRWIANNKESRDFVPSNNRVKRLPESITAASVPDLLKREDVDLSPFKFMSDLFWESFGGTIFVVAEWFFLGVMVVLLRVVLIISVGFEHSTYSILFDLYVI